METHAVIHFLDCRGRKGECGPCCGVPIPPTLLLAKASHMAAPNLRGGEGDSSAMACGQIAAILWPNQDSEVFLPLWLVWGEIGTTSAIPTAKRDVCCVEEQRNRTAKKWSLSRSQTPSAAQGSHAFYTAFPKEHTPS